MKYITRHLEEVIIKLSDSFPAILLTGPRQTGKTTMLRMLAEKENSGRRYVSLDDLTARELAKNDPALFLDIHKPPILIDEVQYAPELFTYIKIHIDTYLNPGDFWMTGSQIFSLMRGVQESLAGRVAILSMSPLSQREIAKKPSSIFDIKLDSLVDTSSNLQPLDTLEIYNNIWNGSMPGLISGLYADRDIYYSSYLATYIARDVKDISSAVDALKFNRFITAVAARTSQLLNFQAIANDAEITVQTAKEWMNILETLGIIFLLHPYSNNVLKRTIKTPKVYFYDTGLVCYLTKWSSPEVALNGAMSGALFENYAVSEIVKGYQNIGKVPNLYFYRDRDGKEVDIILEKDGKLHPIEIKKSVNPDIRITRTFQTLNKYPLEIGTGAVICMANSVSAFNKDNLIIPVWAL
ncbi:MAG: ATP-binding protein [Christensenellales bacterium]|jgi:predicted AAA+ superfamily ATPase|nr:ATP-binding protein [Clostridiales bacterium]